MSLCLIAVHQRNAIVVSDGAETEYLPDGSTIRSRNDCPKFRAIGDHIVASTGTVPAVERVYAEIARGHSGDFAAACSLLAHHLPLWHEQDAERLSREASHLTGEACKPGCDVVVIGTDRVTGLACAVAFEPTTNYRPVRVVGYVAMGCGVPLASSLMADAWRQGSWHTLPKAMRKVVRKVGKKDPHVGGETFSHAYEASRVAVRSGGTPLAFGETLFVTVIPFDAVSGGGNALPSLHLRGARETFTAIKQIVYPPTAYVTTGYSATFDGAGQLNFATTAGGIIPVALPPGVTITNVAADIYLDGGNLPPIAGINGLCEYVGNDITESVVVGATASVGGWQSVGGSGSHLVGVQPLYFRQLYLGGANIKYGPLTITYTTPSPDKTL